MPFGIIGRAGPGIRQILGFGNRSTGRGTFWDKFGGAPLYPMETLRRTCATAPRRARPSWQITFGRLVIRPTTIVVRRCAIDRVSGLGQATYKLGLHPCASVIKRLI